MSPGHVNATTSVDANSGLPVGNLFAKALILEPHKILGCREPRGPSLMLSLVEGVAETISRERPA